MRRDNAPGLIRALFEDAMQDGRSWLAEDYHGEYGRGFRADDELAPATSRCAEFQALIDRLVTEGGVAVPPRAGEMRVKDVAARLGQDTASLGLTRYYVLVEGARALTTDDLVIEFKQARRSALAGLTPPSEYDSDGRARRVTRAQHTQLVNGDVYGARRVRGHLSSVTRERSPFRDNVDLDDLSKKEWKTYARICGPVAHAHALADEAGTSSVTSSRRSSPPSARPTSSSTTSCGSPRRQPPGCAPITSTSGPTTPSARSGRRGPPTDDGGSARPLSGIRARSASCPTGSPSAVGGTPTMSGSTSEGSQLMQNPANSRCRAVAVGGDGPPRGLWR